MVRLDETTSKDTAISLRDDPDQLRILDSWGDRDLVKLANHYGRNINAPVNPDGELLHSVADLSLDAWPLVKESTLFLEHELGVLRASTNTETKYSGDEIVEEAYECVECHKTVSLVETSGFRVDRFVPVIRAAIRHQLDEHHSS